jgi:hypothetical protein
LHICHNIAFISGRNFGLVIKIEYFNSKSKRREGWRNEESGRGRHKWRKGGKEKLSLAFIPP